MPGLLEGFEARIWVTEKASFFSKREVWLGWVGLESFVRQGGRAFRGGHITRLTPLGLADIFSSVRPFIHY